jgi:hypothetical protein
MRLLIRSCAALALTLSLPLAAAPAPLHSQFLPPDDLTLRAEAPDQQQLLQVTEYSVVVGNQRQSTQQPIPVTSPPQGQVPEQGRDHHPGDPKL